MSETDKRYFAWTIEWDNELEEYMVEDDFTDMGDGRCLYPGLTGWDTVDEFVAWFDALPEQERLGLPLFRVVDDITDSTMMVGDGTYDRLILDLDAERYPTPVAAS